MIVTVTTQLRYICIYSHEESKYTYLLRYFDCPHTDNVEQTTLKKAQLQSVK